MNIKLVFAIILFACVCGSYAQETNVALGGMAVADSEYGGDSAAKAIDGKWVLPSEFVGSNRWHAALEKPHPHWIWTCFRQPARISRVVIHLADVLGQPLDLVGEYTTDGGFTFQELFSTTGGGKSTFEFAPVMTDNFRLRITRSSNVQNPNYTQVSEIEVFGEYVVQERPPIAAQPLKLPGPKLKSTKPTGVRITQSADEVEFRSNWLRLSFSRKAPQITAICWDSLGKGKVDENLLKPEGARPALELPFPESSEGTADLELDGNVVRYGTSLSGIPARWEILIEAKSFQMAMTCTMPERRLLGNPPGIRFAFDVSKTPVAPLANPGPGITAPFPVLLHASDYGTLLIQGDGQLIGQPLRHLAQWNCTLVGDAAKRSDGLYVLDQGTSSLEITSSVEACAPMPPLADPRLAALPRHWLNVFQYRPDIGILSNNIVSDNAIFCMHSFTDPAVYTSPLPGGIEAIQLARESLDRYLAGAKGYGVGWENIEMDTYPSLLIAAWDVIRVTGDMDLLRKWMPHLERIASEMERQDRNGNGLPESVHVGIRGKFQFPSSNWWDQINFGHEDAYACALAYRGLKGLSDLEGLAGSPGKSALYQRRADKIRAAYLPNFLNPQTGIIAGWKDSEGKLHDYWFVWVNGIAITYGLVPDDLANKIVDRIEAKMKEVGYSRFDLGLPGNLIPIPKSEYGVGVLGSPQKDDGTDTFGVFENGGATACQAYYYIQALYQLGRKAEADRILWPMMDTYAKGGFQNGVGHGGEWTRWDGSPSGYEGMLSDAYYSQLALFTGYYGIGFGPDGFYLEPWSPLRGKRTPLNLKYMGKAVKEIR